MRRRTWRAVSILIVPAIALASCSHPPENEDDHVASYQHTSQLSRLDEPGREQIKQTVLLQSSGDRKNCVK